MNSRQLDLTHIIVAKTDTSGQSENYLPLSFHLRDTATVIVYLLHTWISPNMHSAMGISKKEMRTAALFLAYVHDIGKATNAFQYSDDEALMQKLEQAVLYPAHPLFLGRRSCPPEGRISLGLRAADLKTALEDEPCLVKELNSRHGKRIVIDEPNGRAMIRDLPLSFSPLNRQYAFRSAREFCHIAENEHDPMQELR